MSVSVCPLPAWSRLLGASLALLLIPALLGANARAATPIPEAEYLIITPAAFVADFQRLADHRAAEGLTASVVAYEDAVAQPQAHGDAVEDLRTFLIAAHASGGARYVLLGGDVAHIPTAQAVYGTVFVYEAMTDQYYACLDGAWDIDGNGIFDDFASDVDIVPDVALGRVPVSSVQQVRAYVDKVLAYDASATEPYRRRALFLDAVLSPYPWHPGMTVQHDAAAWADDMLVPAFETATVPCEVDPLYQNHEAYDGAGALTRDSALAALESGDFGFVHAAGHSDASGWDCGDALLTANDVVGQRLPQPPYFLEAGLEGESCAVDANSVGVALILQPEGGAVAALGPSGIAYITYGEFEVEDFWSRALAPGARVGSVRTEVVVDLSGSISSSAFRWMMATWTLLGDPALCLAPQARVTADVLPIAKHTVRLVGCAPNPFNPLTEIGFSVQGSEPVAVTLEVFDLAGHRIATLTQGPFAPGDHAVTWNGRDRRGEAAQAGVYLARLTDGATSDVIKLTLVK